MVKQNNLKALTGGAAAAEAIRQINPDVFSAYPITPQTPIIQGFAQMVADKKVETKFILVESEHSALSVIVGSTAAGGRSMTATSSQGLALMSEILPVASGMRLPIVMNLATRALSSPINIHNDHQDAMMVRDLGWIQIFCENNQEVYENNFLAVRLAESPEVMLPVMVCQDGFITSHNIERVTVWPDRVIKKFLGEYRPKHFLLDLKNPSTMGPFAMPDYYFEIKHQVVVAMEKAKKTYLAVGRELRKITGHRYGCLEKYFLADARAVIVVMGSTAGTVRGVVEEMRKQGKKVGLLKINLFRPFPYQEVKRALAGVGMVGVLERTMGFGSVSPLAGEIRISLAGKRIRDYSFGLGGRDIGAEEIEKIFLQLLGNRTVDRPQYIGLRK